MSKTIRELELSFARFDSNLAVKKNDMVKTFIEYEEKIKNENVCNKLNIYRQQLLDELNISLRLSIDKVNNIMESKYKKSIPRRLIDFKNLFIKIKFERKQEFWLDLFNNRRFSLSSFDLIKVNKYYKLLNPKNICFSKYHFFVSSLMLLSQNKFLLDSYTHLTLYNLQGAVLAETFTKHREYKRIEFSSKAIYYFYSKLKTIRGIGWVDEKYFPAVSVYDLNLNHKKRVKFKKPYDLDSQLVNNSDDFAFFKFNKCTQIIEIQFYNFLTSQSHKLKIFNTEFTDKCVLKHFNHEKIFIETTYWDVKKSLMTIIDRKTLNVLKVFTHRAFSTFDDISRRIYICYIDLDDHDYYEYQCIKSIEVRDFDGVFLGNIQNNMMKNFGFDGCGNIFFNVKKNETSLEYMVF